MKALVLGCGSIGRRHIAHLRQLGLSDIEAVDTNLATRERVQASLGIRVLAYPEEGLARRPDVVLVCTPASSHIEMVRRAVEAGAHVFVEKPLATTLDGTEDLLRQVRRDGRVVHVGYNLRYHPAVRVGRELVRSGRLGKLLMAHLEFGLYLQKWWEGRDYRQSYMVRRDLGGDLILDSSHEIDLALMFLGPAREVTAYAGKLSRLEIEGPDVVKILLRMASGALATLSVDCIRPTYSRGFQLNGEDSGLRWSCADGRADGSLGELELCAGGDRWEPVPVRGNPQDTYLEELKDFLSAVSSGSPSPVPMDAGVDVLRVVAAVQRSLETGRSVEV